MGETTGSNAGNENDDLEEATPESRGERLCVEGKDVGGLGLAPSGCFDVRLEKREPSLEVDDGDEASVGCGGCALLELLAFLDDGRLGLSRSDSRLPLRNPAISTKDPCGLLPFRLSVEPLGAGLGIRGTGTGIDISVG
jgi:hypothetical protein